jgi:hypothetical protein
MSVHSKVSLYSGCVSSNGNRLVITSVSTGSIMLLDYEFNNTYCIYPPENTKFSNFFNKYAGDALNFTVKDNDNELFNTILTNNTNFDKEKIVPTLGFNNGHIRK